MTKRLLIALLLLAAPAVGQDYGSAIDGYQQRLTALKAERAELAERAEQLDRGIAQHEGAIGAATGLQNQAQEAAQQAATEAAKAAAAAQADEAE